MTFIVILVILAVIVFAVIAMYNKLVRLRNTVKSSWSDIDVQCKKRLRPRTQSGRDRQGLCRS